MLERREELARLMTEEQGKPLRMARNEVGYAADFLLWFAEEAKRVYGETIPSARADQRFLVLHQPVGVAAAITPWNYPISMLTRKVAPALAAGCTIVVKPAEQTPLCAVETFRVFEDAGFPPGVVNLVTTSDPGAGGRRARSPTGRSARSPSPARPRSASTSPHGAAEQMKRVSLELGGHAPFIVFDDADPEHAAKGPALVKFLNTGQACICPNRIFVQRLDRRPVRRHACRPGRKPPRRQRARRRRDRRPAHRRAGAGQDAAPGRRRPVTGRHRRAGGDRLTGGAVRRWAASTPRRCSPTSRPTWASTGRRRSGRSPRSSSSTTRTR